MTRLIDATRLRTEVDLLLARKKISPNTMMMIKNLIDRQPTVEAIPKEKLQEIVERLEENKKVYLEGYGTHQNDELYGVACGFGDAIAIVKEVGGMND